MGLMRSREATGRKTMPRGKMVMLMLMRRSGADDGNIESKSEEKY